MNKQKLRESLQWKTKKIEALKDDISDKKLNETKSGKPDTKALIQPP